MNRGGFSWKRLLGVTRAKQRVSRKIGIPLTRSGRQRKIGAKLTGGGCMIPLVLGAMPGVMLGAHFLWRRLAMEG